MNMCSYSCCTPLTLESKHVTSLSNLLRVVTEESRLKILCVLRRGKHCVSEMLNHVDMSQSLTSHHLGDLKEAGIVQYEKRGLQVFYSLTDEGKRITDLLFEIPKKEVAIK